MQQTCANPSPSTLRNAVKIFPVETSPRIFRSSTLSTTWQQLRQSSISSNEATCSTSVELTRHVCGKGWLVQASKTWHVTNRKMERHAKSPLSSVQTQGLCALGTSVKLATSRRSTCLQPSQFMFAASATETPPQAY